MIATLNSGRDKDMLTKRKRYILFVIVALTGGAILCFCGNVFHQTQAAGVVTMADCLSCHDGITGRAITVCLGNECLYTKNHSVMHRYPPVGKESNYAPQGEIEQAGCILEGGKITCLSCHNLANPPPHLIREGDKLCLICHIARKSR